MKANELLTLTRQSSLLQIVKMGPRPMFLLYLKLYAMNIVETFVQKNKEKKRKINWQLNFFSQKKFRHSSKKNWVTL